MRKTILILAFLLVFSGALEAQEIPLEQIQTAIAAGVEIILETQNDAGGFELSEGHWEMYPVGSTGLAVMALQYARPHLKGELRVRTFAAIRKGLGFICQRPVEQKTYSAGFILCALYKESPTRYAKPIERYAAALVVSQHVDDSEHGMWSYNLRLPTRDGQRGKGRLDRLGDKSNTQIALLGLYYANRSGFQIPKWIWKNSRKHYLSCQFHDAANNGGWGYRPSLRPKPYANMTIASTISLNLCNEMLVKRRKQCKPPPKSQAIEDGLDWIDRNWESGRIGSDTYGLYALERLAIIMGRANIGKHDWYNEGARTLIGRRRWSSMFGTPPVSATFGVMFLSRGLEPVVMNKLIRRGTQDWNNTPYDVKHMVEYIQDHYQHRVQWRIVSLEAPMHVLQKVPILHMSGHEALDFNDEERKKLKAYVDNGGTIFAQACCSKRPFAKSFRTLVEEMFGGPLKPLPKAHRIYQRMRIHGLAPKPPIEFFAYGNQSGRPVVIFMPFGKTRDWHLGGSRADRSFTIGTGIYLYITIEGRKMFLRARPEAAPPRPKREEPTPARDDDDADEEE